MTGAHKPRQQAYEMTELRRSNSNYWILARRFRLSWELPRYFPASSDTVETRLCRSRNQILALLLKTDLVSSFQGEYLSASSGLVDTNTFNEAAISQKEYKCKDFASESIRLAHELVMRAAAQTTTTQTSVRCKRDRDHQSYNTLSASDEAVLPGSWQLEHRLVSRVP